MRGRRALAALVLAAALAGFPATAAASWQAGGSIAGYSKAETMPAGAVPAVGVSGRNVTVEWTAASLPGGGSLDGYLVSRYDGGGEAQTVGAGCAGTIAALSCTERAVPPGSWRYTVTPVLQGWRGAESSASAAVAVGSPAMTLGPSTVTGLPAVLSGQITDFAEAQAVSFRLDDPSAGPLLSGSIEPGPVPANGTASVSVTLPVGTSNGAHTVYAVGDRGDVASVAIALAVPLTISSPAWELRDASSGAEQDASAPTAFAGDGLAYTTGFFGNAFSSSRYVEWAYGSPLRPGVETSSVSFDLRFRASSETACFHFEVISGGSVIGSHGALVPGGPESAWCAGTSDKLVSTPLPEVTSTDVANGLRIKLYGYESKRQSIVADEATVSGTASPSQSFTLYETTQVDAAGKAQATAWPLAAAGDGAVYSSASKWPGAFGSAYYLHFGFPAYVPAGDVVKGVSFVHSYRSGGSTTCWYFEVYAGGSLIGTHGSAAAPVSCNSSTSAFVTDTVPLPEVTTAAQANGLSVKAYVDNAGAKKSEDDLDQLSITYVP